MVFSTSHTYLLWKSILVHVRVRGNRNGASQIAQLQVYTTGSILPQLSTSSIFTSSYSTFSTFYTSSSSSKDKVLQSTPSVSSTTPSCSSTINCSTSTRLAPSVSTTAGMIAGGLLRSCLQEGQVPVLKKEKFHLMKGNKLRNTLTIKNYGND